MDVYETVEYSAPVDQLRVCIQNPFSYRDVTLANCIELLAKVIVSGGWDDISSYSGLGVYVTGRKECSPTASSEEQAATAKSNRERPILYVGK